VIVHRLAALIVACGCGGTEQPVGAPAIFPTDYQATYQEARGCKLSLEHSARIRILASLDAASAYGRTAPFLEGAIVLKEQYAYSDVDCTGPIERYTVMRKLPIASSPDTLDWEWQEVAADLHEEQDTDVGSCVGCHDSCGKPPMGYDWTCDEPLD
jgi:hypothetical protein